jgi:hypothetical protein
MSRLNTTARHRSSSPTVASWVGVGFLPDHDVTIRVAYTDDDATDYLAFAADSAGEFLAALPTSSTASALHISATDHRVNPNRCGLVWSNTATIDGTGW